MTNKNTSMLQIEESLGHHGSNRNVNQITWPILKKYMLGSATYFIDIYDVYVMGLFVLIISLVYYDGDLPQITDILLKIGTPFGCLIGQWLCDTFSHKITMPVKNAGLMIVLASTLGQAVTGVGRGVNFIAALFFYRVALGIGFTMDNPFRGIMNSPLAPTATPSLVMKAIFTPIALAVVVGGAVSMAVSGGLRYLPVEQTAVLDYGWRIYQGLVFLPAAITLYYRITEPQDQDLPKDTEKYLPSGDASETTDTPSENQPAPVTWSESIAHFSKPQNLVKLLGSMYTMFAANLVYWGINLNLGVIYTACGYVDNSTPATINFTITLGVIITCVFGLLPSYISATLLIERIGRKNLQLIGFAGLTIMYCVLGFAFDPIKNASPQGYVWLMGVSNMFTQFTPNGTSLPTFNPSITTPSSEPSPNGYIGAMGKFGFVVSQFVFIYLKNIGGPTAFVPQLYKIFALATLIGFIVTLVLPNTQPYKKSD